jgi:dipeptidyl aminopeptidase/acylaminoacyl peptidase
MKSLRVLIVALWALTACTLLGGEPVATLVPTLVIEPSPTPQTPPSTPTPITETATIVPVSEATPTSAGGPQFIAYVQNEQLLVANVTGGTNNGATQYTLAGVDDKVIDLAWSPSGEFVAFVSGAKEGEARLFVVYAVGAGTPVDLGPGVSPAWSPDSRTLAFMSTNYPDNNIWITTLENPERRQLTFEREFNWGRPAFTPDGNALIVVGQSFFETGATGNTHFALERLALDGSGARERLPGTRGIEGYQLPFDLRFSPDGQRVAFSANAHISACAAQGAAFIGNADGTGIADYYIASLRQAEQPEQERYYVTNDYAWLPDSSGVLISAQVRDCSLGAAEPGAAVAGPQLTVVKLDGAEGLTIPGQFAFLSVDRAGQMVAASRYESFDAPGRVHVYSLTDGKLLLDLGEGMWPQLQP